MPPEVAELPGVRVRQVDAPDAVEVLAANDLRGDHHGPRHRRGPALLRCRRGRRGPRGRAPPPDLTELPVGQGPGPSPYGPNIAAVSKLERLLNLTAALLDIPRPLTVEDIREAIPGYPDNEPSFRRSFERDKDDLREMGVPIEVVPGPGDRPSAARLRDLGPAVLPARPGPRARRAGRAAARGPGHPARRRRVRRRRRPLPQARWRRTSRPAEVRRARPRSRRPPISRSCSGRRSSAGSSCFDYAGERAPYPSVPHRLPAGPLVPDRVRRDPRRRASLPARSDRRSAVEVDAGPRRSSVPSTPPGLRVDPWQLGEGEAVEARAFRFDAGQVTQAQAQLGDDTTLGGARRTVRGRHDPGDEP